MTDTVIRVENLGKLYRIGSGDTGYKTFRETLVDSALAPFQRLGAAWSMAHRAWSKNKSSALPAPGSMLSSQSDDLFWALKDVSFEVKQGEVVGIIGRNGAGKSTLLKILSKITEPTEGRVELKGRVGSLLEVGTGFHPELTGHENVYLYGAILGMDRWEITRKFDEIIAFAELEKFVDTPVKRYSSGMYMRLAFAVAAHLEPEILLVDEVLAVGDMAFQKKCLGKMDDVSKEGRTVLFVSHNISAVRNLCTQSIWLQAGHLHQSGDTQAITEAYLRESLRAESLSDVATLISTLPPDPAIRLESIKVMQNGVHRNTIFNGEPLEIEIGYTVLSTTSGLRVYFDLLDYEGNILIRSFHDDDATAMPIMKPGQYVSTAIIPQNLLAPRIYEIRVRATIFNIRSCTGEGIGIPLTVESDTSANSAYPFDTIRSKLQPRIPWHMKKVG